MTVVDGRTARWEGHRDTRRAEIVAAAVTVIGREGPAVGVDVIARELGTSRPAVYRHFDDRADLDRAVADRIVELFTAHLAPHLRVVGPVDDAIGDALDSYLDWILANPHLWSFLRSAGGPADRIRSTVAARTAQLIKVTLLQTRSRPLEVADAVGVGLVGLADAMIGHWVDHPGSTSRRELRDDLVRMIRSAAEAAVGPVEARPR